MAKPLLWLALLCASLTFATCADLHLKLTHVDAKESCTDEERMRGATERTHRRLATTRARLAENQYFVEYLIGDPPQKAEAIVDTASNLVWTQSAACSVCFRQNLPRYDPSRSRTARNVTCSDAACIAGTGSVTQCSRSRTECYVYSATAYNAFEVIAGDLSTDEFTFGSEKVSLAFGSIGASSLTSGSLDGASGIVGLGRGPLSLVSQLGETKFSYCLTPFFSNAINPSHLLVGASAVLSGNAPITSVPFVKNPKEDPFSTYYYLPLAGITVGKAKLDVPAAAFDLREVKPGKWAGTMVDSGSPFMRLVDVAYQALKAELEQQLGGSLMRPPKRVLGRKLELCVAQGDLGRLVPPLVLHFGGGGGDVVLPPENYWAPVGSETACMVVFSSAGKIRSWPRNETTVIGSFMQQNMQLLFDLGKDVLSFQPTDCSSFKPADPGQAGTGTGKRGLPSASSSSSSTVPLPLPVFCLMSLLMFNGAPGVRGL